MIRLFESLAGAIFLLFLLCLPAFADEQPRFGLWVEAEGRHQPFLSEKTFLALSEFTEKGQFTDLYCQVYRGGRSWFPSMLADDTPYREALAQGLDPLRRTIDMAHARGQRVYAWVNSLRLAGNSDAPLIKVAGKDAVLVDRFGNSLLHYNSKGQPPGKAREYLTLGTPGLWLDPSSKAMQQFLLGTIEDLILRYPDLDGVHLDMIRFPLALPSAGQGQKSISPFAAFGYSKRAVQDYWAFAENAEKSSQTKRPSGENWNQWRRSQVTLLVVRIKELINRLAPTMTLSIAGLSGAGRMKTAFQDWPSWLESGVLDFVVPMNYSKSRKRAARMSREAVELAGSKTVHIGLGAWMMLNNHQALMDEARTALQTGAGGVVLFSYSNLFSKNGEKLVNRVRGVVRPG